MSSEAESKPVVAEGGEEAKPASPTPIFGASATFGAGTGFGGFGGVAASATSGDAAAAGEEGGEEEAATEEECQAEFKPVVQLEEVAVSTGEEEEEALFDAKCKLYRYDNDAGEWKERGVGQGRILRHKESNKIRFLMRQDKTLKIRGNHIIMPGTKVQEHGGSDKAMVWSCVDFADESQRMELFCIRFASAERAQQFQKAYHEAGEKMEALIGAPEFVEQSEESKAADELASEVEKKAAVLAAAALLGIILVAPAEAALRKPDAFQGCANFTAIKDPELQAAVGLIRSLNLLPAGLPDDMTFFLPSNDSLRAVLVGGPIPTPSSNLDVILSKPLIPEVAQRLNSIMLYHMALVGAATPGELAEEGLVPTALGPDHTLTFEEAKEARRAAAAARYTLADATGRQAAVGAPLDVCASTVFKIDKVMMPAARFMDIPLLTQPEAVCLLTGFHCRAPAFSLPSPTLSAHAFQGRRLLDDSKANALEACSLSMLARELPEASAMLQVIQAFNLLPDGVPAGATIFLPNNAAAQGLTAELELPSTLEYIVGAADALGPQLKQRLISIVAYHVSPTGAKDPAALAAVGELATALGGNVLLVTNSSDGRTLLTDARGQQAGVVGGPPPAVLDACGSAVYALDKVLMPADSLADTPRTTAAEAMAVFESAVDFAMQAPAPTPAAAPGPAPLPYL
ncbi:RAN binding [Micractinium conductrix]|uniref:RAN binding n=1 Tax=Micractinium conductrix TaxID=554055 RepID=A0A2P6V6R1_9CHLO|nr:RAN binding [Micractinium conductrix]|eukprot:PSC69770.1 RAN binding [Micractinium conductrix]